MPRDSWPSRRLTASFAAPQAAAQTVALAQQQIASRVPALIPPVTSSRLYSQMQVMPGDSVTATTAAEQTYQSQALLAANSLVLGQSVIIKGAGVYSTSTVLPPSQRARVRLGGQTVIDTGAISVPVSLSACRFMFDCQFIVRAVGTAGCVEAFGLLHFATSLTVTIPVLAGPSGAVGENGNPVTVDTTQPLSLALSVQFGSVPTTSALQAANISALRQLSVHTLRPVTS